MTKIYIYCLFDAIDSFMGVYSSLRAAHRDALKLSNKGTSSVYMVVDNCAIKPSLTELRNHFRGKCDTEICYRTSSTLVRIYKMLL